MGSGALRDNTVLAQAMRYLLAGGLVFSLDVGVFYLITTVWPAWYIEANLVSKSIGALTGFFLHRYFTFSWEHRDNAAAQGVMYVLLLGFNLMLSSLLLYLLVEWVGLIELYAKVLTDVLVILVAFVGSRLLVFRGHRRPA